MTSTWAPLPVCYSEVLLRNEKGKAVLDFKGIPVEQVSQLAQALTGELPPVREVRLLEKPAMG